MEEDYNQTDVEVAIMLLGSVAFVMGLIFLVTWKDEDIRRYSWKIISTTVSIFLAVLLFQGNNQMLMLVIEHWSNEAKSACQYGHCLVYILLLQVTMAYISGVLVPPGGVRDERRLGHMEWIITDGYSVRAGEKVEESKVVRFTKEKECIKGYIMEEDTQRELLCERRQVKEEINLMMQCWARLFAHMAGFAAINAGATMQQDEIFAASPHRSWIPVFINAVAILIVFHIFGMIRTAYMEKFKGKQGANRAALMQEAAFEAENDISSLSISFLTVQVLRFYLTMELPDEEGMVEGEGEHPHDISTILTLYGFGLVFALVACGFVVVQAKLESQHSHDKNQTEEEHEAEITVWERVVMISLNANAMCFAWCFLWATRWICEKYSFFAMQTIIGRVTLAFALSMLAGVLVFGLDTVDDSQKAGDTASKGSTQAIQMLVNALGILVGFSWEHCFDGSVGAMAEIYDTALKRGICKFLLGLLIAVVITPMWRQHFLEKEIMYQRLKDELGEMDEDGTQTPSGSQNDNAPLVSPSSGRERN